MMLLAAIVLLVAFLSLTALVARVSVVEQETSRDVSPAVLREAEAVERAVKAIDKADLLGTGDTALAALESLEGERGFLLSLQACSGNKVTAYLSDAQSSLSFVVSVADCN